MLSRMGRGRRDEARPGDGGESGGVGRRETREVER
jgi:hypothetical protein